MIKLIHKFIYMQLEKNEYLFSLHFLSLPNNASISFISASRSKSRDSSSITFVLVIPVVARGGGSCVAIPDDV